MAKSRKQKGNGKAPSIIENPSKGIEMTIAQHEFGKMIPEMIDEQFIALKDDIEEQGLKDKIILYEGQILEGWHRYKAMCELGRAINHKTQVEPFDGNRSEALHYVVSKNLKRRHLEPKQIGMVLNKYKEHSSYGGGKTIREMAKESGTSDSTIERTGVVTRKGIPELQLAVSKSSKEEGSIGAQDGERIAQLPPKEQKKAIKEALKPPKAPTKEANIKPAIRADIIYTGTLTKEIRNVDPPAKKDCVWYFRCKPDDIHAAFEIISEHGFEVVSFMTVAVTEKQRHNDPFSDGLKDLVLIATHGDPESIRERKSKFGSVMPEQKFLEHMNNVYSDAKLVKSTFFGSQPSQSWQKWNGGK